MSRHLMARFRHLHAANEHGLDFDWQPFRYSWEDENESPTNYTAKLENGDWILAQSGHRNNWGYNIYGPHRRTEDLDKDGLKYDSYQKTFHPEGYGSEKIGRGGFGPSADPDTGEPRLTYINDPHGAMSEAESHYKRLNRTGITPSHGEDYDINDIMRRFDGGEL